MRILVTGATGFVGSVLSKKLIDQGHELYILTRGNKEVPAFMQPAKVKVFQWTDTSVAPPLESIEGIDGVINLMGENISAKRWGSEQKEKLANSRIISTENLTKLLDENLKSPIKFFISSSAVGIYPVNQNTTFDESSKLGNHFLANLCKDWESAAHTIKKAKRIVIIRTAVVLEKSGGALKKMLPPFELGLGGPIGDGNQMMSWIHLEDLVSLYVAAVNDESFEGVYNGTAPVPVNNFDFTKALGEALHRPTLFPVPTMALKIMFGEMSSVILDSQSIVSTRLKEKGFSFKYPTIESAFTQIFKDKH